MKYLMLLLLLASFTYALECEASIVVSLGSFDISQGVSEWCGDNIKNLAEQCDNIDFGSSTCVTEGFASGSLSCTASCTLDTSGCVSSSSSTGGGGGGSITSDCPDGIIDDACYCEDSKRYSGYCYDDVYYLESQDDVPEDNQDTIYSDVIDSYYMGISSDKYSYKSGEDFIIKAETFKSSVPVDIASVTVTVYYKDEIVSKNILDNLETGKYVLYYVNNLPVGNYNFKFIANIDNTDKITVDKMVKISNNDWVHNLTTSPSGHVNVYFIIILIGIILIAIIVIMYLRRKS